MEDAGDRFARSVTNTVRFMQAVKKMGAQTMELVTVYDCIGANLDKITPPPGVKMAGYITGSGGVPWTAKQFSQYPDAIRIDQAPVNTPAGKLADAYDIEFGAMTLADLPDAIHGATENFRNGARPGQRSPVTYQSRSNVTPVVNTLVNAGITSGVGLWIAEETSFDEAANEVIHASGPFPVIGRQYSFNTLFDVSVFNAEWFKTVSAKTPVTHTVPGFQDDWKWCHKCEGLFYGPNQVKSRCPVGGMHDGTGSYNYEMGFRN